MDNNIEKTMEDLEQYRLMKKLQCSIAKLVIEYGQKRINPGLMAGALFTAGAKVASALSQALIEKSKADAKLAEDEKGACDESAQ